MNAPAASAPRAFAEWLAKKVAAEAREKVVVADWLGAKADLATRVKKDRNRLAPTALLTDHIRALVSLAYTEQALRGSGGHAHRSSRQGLDLEKMLRRLLLHAAAAAAEEPPALDALKRKPNNKAPGLISKGIFDDALALEVFSLLADRNAAAKAIALNELTTRTHFNQNSPDHDGVFQEDAGDAEAQSRSLAAKKQLDAQEKYAEWLRNKRGEERARAVVRKKDIAALEIKVTETNKAVAKALRVWRRTQRAVRRHENKFPSEDSTTAEIRERYDERYERLTAARQAACVDANAKCADLKKLKRDLKDLHNPRKC